MGRRHFVGLIAVVCATLLSSTPALAQFSQQGQKLVATGAAGSAGQGTSVALSADGNTAIVGAFGDNFNLGAAWVLTRSGGVWTQQGPKLVGSGSVGGPPSNFAVFQGQAVALSADGNTAIVGGDGDDANAGAAWVWTRSGNVWTQQGPKLVGSGAVGKARQGFSVALSGDGNTAIVGGFQDNASPGAIGAAWVWARTGGVWTQQGPKLLGSDTAGPAHQGESVALSADGNTAIVGGTGDVGYGGIGTGAAWVWTRSGSVWTQQGPKLVGSGAVGWAFQGSSVALSADGNTTIVGGSADDIDDKGTAWVGAAWVWTRSGSVWTQQGAKLVGSGAVGRARQGFSVSLSGDGSTALVGGPFDDGINSGFGVGATWVWTRSGSVWTQQGAKLVGSGAVGSAIQGRSVALSAAGNTAIVGGYGDNSRVGAAWVFVLPPTIGSLSNVFTRANTPIPVSIAVDAAGGPSGVTLSGASSNTTVVPNANLVFSGSGASRTLTITPAANQKGETTITVSASDSTGTASTTFMVKVGLSPSGDFDGDGRADVTVFRPSTGAWYVRGVSTMTWGGGADVPVVGDYDGDGLSDMAVFRPSNGTWYLRSSINGSMLPAIVWGGVGDVPVPGDYDGDGKTDVAVFRPSNGTWYVRHSSTGALFGLVWGGQGDVAAPGDYDGDGLIDVAVFRPSNGTWYLRSSINGGLTSVVWGGVGDVAVAGDYDGDGRTDTAVFRGSNGTWYIRNSSTGLNEGLLWGGPGDIPVPGDYDADGKTDMAVFRISIGTWYIRNSSTGSLVTVVWGGPGDIAVLGRQ